MCIRDSNDIVSAHPECSETTMEYDYEDGHTWASYWPEVLAVFAVQNNLNNDGDVVVIDESKKRLIQDTFWAMHEISAEVEEVTVTPVSYTHLDVYKRQHEDKI